jgi:multiple sugar transport system permease protein
VLYLVLWLPLLLVVVFVLALAMDAKRTRFARLTQFVSYLPGAVTGSAAALLWIFMFSPTVSPIGPALKLFAGKSGSFISDDTLTIVLAVMGVSIGAGGWIVIVFGALTSIPGEILDAAKVDGANAWHTVWHIKLPMIRSYIAFILIVSTAGGFQVFVEPKVIGTASPGQISHTWSLNELVYSYSTIESNDGRASALSILLLIVCVVLALVVIKKTKFYSIGDR